MTPARLLFGGSALRGVVTGRIRSDGEGLIGDTLQKLLQIQFEVNPGCVKEFQRYRPGERKRGTDLKKEFAAWPEHATIFPQRERHVGDVLETDHA